MDPRLVERAQGGDESAFAILTEQSVARFQRVAFGILRDADLAADATQAALVRIWQKLPRLREPSRFESWAHKLLIHACYAEAKRARRAEPSLAVAAEGSVPDAVDAFASRDQLERAFQRLKVEQRTLIVLRVYLDLSVEEVATILDLPRGTVKSRLHRALGAMRAALEADERQGVPANPSMEPLR